MAFGIKNAFMQKIIYFLKTLHCTLFQLGIELKKQNLKNRQNDPLSDLKYFFFLKISPSNMGILGGLLNIFLILGLLYLKMPV